MRRIAAYALAAIAPLALALFLGWWQVDGPGAGGSEVAGPALAQRPLPLTQIEFALSDHQGAPVSSETLAGRPSMVFFGFTFCPDVCPTTLADISGWLDDLGPEEAERLNTVFITIDPERDDVATMAEYVGSFHPTIRGWTGPLPEIDKVVAGFHARYEKIPLQGGGYTMGHTASVFLFAADGRFVSTIDFHESRDFAVPKIRRAMGKTAEATN